MIDTKKVLIISTHFAPDAHVGAKRPTKFCKFLPEFGWDPIVITKAINSYHRLDKAILDNLPANLQICRVKRWRFLQRLDSTLFTTSISWLLPAFFMAWRISKKQKVNVILSTAPGYEAHAVALLVKIFTGKKWVCEYRDLRIFSNEYNPVYKLIRWADRWLTRLELKKSDFLIFVNRSLRNKYLIFTENSIIDKNAVMYNGFDLDEFKNIINRVGKKRGKFKITYIGTWGGGRTPEPILLSLKLLINNNLNIAYSLKVEFVGEFKFDPKLEIKIKKMVNDNNLNKIVVFSHFISHKKALEKMINSNLLLMVLPESQIDFTPAKMFEYLYSSIPILAVVPPKGECAEIIIEIGAGVVVSPTDISAIEEAIQNAYERFQRGQLKINPNQAVIAKFDRRRQTERLAGIFNRLIEHNSN